MNAHPREMPTPGETPTPGSTATDHTARISYQWKQPGATSHHGYAMGVVQCAERTEESVIQALKAKHPNLNPFEIVIIRLEWR